jgi:hypothetical protein
VKAEELINNNLFQDIFDRKAVVLRWFVGWQLSLNVPQKTSISSGYFYFYPLYPLV